MVGFQMPCFFLKGTVPRYVHPHCTHLKKQRDGYSVCKRCVKQTQGIFLPFDGKLRIVFVVIVAVEIIAFVFVVLLLVVAVK
jgi:hypothetical protein